MSITTLYLVRHGETEWNALKKLQGQLDSPLTDNGKAQAEAVAKQAADWEVELIVSSPLGRAYNTAKYSQLILNKALKKDHALVERDFGGWQGALFESLTGHENFESVFFEVTESAPPGGESGIDCGNRIMGALKLIAQDHKERSILVVTHGDAIRCLHFLLNGESGCDAYSQYGNGRVFRVQFCHRTLQLCLA